MGKVLVEKMLPILTVTKWPETVEPTLLGRQAYFVGLDKADEYSDNPMTLTAAIRTFQSGESRPYAFAGVAYTLIKASQEKDFTYAKNGLIAALEWLEKAQEMAPDIVEINMIEALIYIYQDRFEDARIVLDYLETIDSRDYFVLRAEAAYWSQQHKLNETVEWLEKAIAQADTVPRKLRLRVTIGDSYMSAEMNEQALEVYKEAIHFAKESAQLWHKLTVVNWRLEDYEEADRCNRRALSLKPDYPEALEVQEALKEEQNSGGLSRRIFGR